MRYTTLFIFLFLSSLQAAPIDRSISTFEDRQKKGRIDKFDFAGTYDELEMIDIDAKRKMRVEMDLSGNYPILSTITYEGSFGALNGKITGSFPNLHAITINCTSAILDLDFRGADFEKECEILLSSKGDITVFLPNDIPLIVHTKTALKGKGKVIQNCLDKQGFGIFNKTFTQGNSPPLLTFYIETKDGKINLKNG